MDLSTVLDENNHSSLTIGKDADTERQNNNRPQESHWKRYSRIQLDAGVTANMVFRNLFKPKWQHRDPNVRRQALLALDPQRDDAKTILANVARQDEEPELRQLALKRLSDLALLWNAAESDKDAAVRASAHKRYMHLLAGTQTAELTLDQRLTALNTASDARIHEFVAQKSADAPLRKAALQQVERESVLVHIAAHDPEADLRAVALGKINEKNALERVLEATRTRDKHISRLARERLDALIAAEELPGRIRQQRIKICDALETLAKRGDWRRNEEELQRLEQEWAGLELEAEPELASRYQETREKALGALAEYKQQEQERLELERRYAPARAEKETICSALEGVLADLTARETLAAGDVGLVDTALSINEKAWSESGALPEAEQNQYGARFRHAGDAIRARRDQLLRADALLEHMEALGQKAEALTSHEETDERQIEDLTRAWQQLERPKVARAQAITERFDTAMQSLRTRISAKRQAREAALDRVKEQIKSLEEALDRGELNAAIDAQRQAQKTVVDFHDKIPQKLQLRLQRAAKQINELKNWQNWAATPKKEQLIADVEALIGSDRSPPDIAREVQQARQAWKSLGPAAPSREKALWERFNDACTKAYEPAAAYFETQAQQRKSNQTARQEFLDKLDTFVAEAHWDEVDWKKVEKLEHEAREEWRNFGPTDRKAAKVLSERFHTVMDGLRQRLQQEWERNLTKRQTLIKRVEELKELDDIHEAVEQTKQAQKEWQLSGRVSPKQERLLWKEFRGACDEIFARRQAVYDARRNERSAAIDAKRSIVEELEKQVTLEGAELEQAASRIKQLESEFLASGSSGDKKRDAELDGRVQRAMKRYRQARKALTTLRQEQKLEQLSDKAALCAELEQLVESMPSSDIVEARLAEIRRHWDTLPALDDDTNKVIEKRFARAVAALSDKAVKADLAREQEQNLKAKEILCIRMEILAGVESPPYAAHARMEYQVARLSKGLGQGEVAEGKTRDAERLELEREWRLVGPVPAAQNSELEKRFTKARAALETAHT